MASIMADLVLRLRSNSADLQRGVETAKQSVKGLDRQTGKLSKNSKKNFGSMQKEATGAFSSIAGSMGAIGPAGQQAVGGFQAMAAGAKMLNAALGPIGIIIAAVALAVKALTSYFRNSVDGAGELAKIMGFLKGILTVIQDAFIKLGRGMVQAFKDPKQAVIDLWDAIQENLINRFKGMVEFFVASFNVLKNGFKGVGQAVKGIFNEEARAESQKYFDQMGKDLQDVAKAGVKMATGLDVSTIVAKSTAEIEKMKVVANAMAALATREYKLKLASIDLIKTEADARKKISELIFISSDKENETLQDRLDATKEAGRLETQLADAKVKQAREALKIQQETMALGENGVADLEKEAQLYATLQGLYKERNDKVREIQNREEEIMTAVRAVGEQGLQMTQAQAQAELKRLAEEKKAEEEAAKAKLKLQEDAIKSLAKYREEKLKESEAGELKVLEDMKNQGIILEEEYQGRVTDVKAKWAKTREDIAKAEADKEKKLAEEVAAKKEELNNKVAELATSAVDSLSKVYEAAKNRELAAAGDNAQKKEEIEKKYAKKQKKLSIAQAIINGALGVTKAFADGGILGFITGALVAAATAAQISVISSQSFAKGGIVTGGSTFGDRTLVRANAGEMFLNKGQQAKLFRMINSGGTGKGKVVFEIQYDKLIGVLENGAQVKGAY